jgi:hypothetical protein
LIYRGSDEEKVHILHPLPYLYIYISAAWLSPRLLLTNLDTKERITKKGDSKIPNTEGKRDLRSPDGPPRWIRLVPREGITELDEVTTQKEKRRETMDFVDGYVGEHELIAGVSTVFCSRCGYRDHFSNLPKECSVSSRQKDREKRDTDKASKERGMGKSG